MYPHLLCNVDVMISTLQKRFNMRVYPWWDLRVPFGQGRILGVVVTPRIRCARCLPVIHRCCHVICLRVAFYHIIMCISFCIRFRLMHPSLFPIVRFAIRHSYALQRSPFVSRCEWVLNFLGMSRGLPSGLGIAPVDRLSSFVPFGVRLILQRLTG